MKYFYRILPNISHRAEVATAHGKEFEDKFKWLTEKFGPERSSHKDKLGIGQWLIETNVAYKGRMGVTFQSYDIFAMNTGVNRLEYDLDVFDSTDVVYFYGPRAGRNATLFKIKWG